MLLPTERIWSYFVIPKNIISITGTKGKTTVAFLIDEILRKCNKNTLRVDTTGHFLNGERKSTLAESKERWDIVPTVCPGKFLYDAADDSVPILECSIGCSSGVGIGYDCHKVGVWTNIFEDHIGNSDRVQSRADIADAKDFIFRRLSGNGYAVFNADEELICKKLDCVAEKFKDPTYKLIPCTFSKPVFDLEKHLNNGGVAFVLENSKIIFKDSKGAKTVYDAKRLPWTFDGAYSPSMINLTFAIAAVYSFFDQKFPDNFAEILDSLRLDPYGGRMTALAADKGTMIIADYAHEKKSLVEIGNLAKSLAKKRGGRAIGIVRLAYDRTDELIRDTGIAVGKAFDALIVYDKIDGYWRKPDKQTKRFPQVVGRISSLFSDAIKTTNADVTVVLREDKAIEAAVEKAGKNDVVIMIVNDDTKRSVDWLLEKFNAHFI